jgi:UDP-glucuronate 4-epimerase
MKILVTGTAGFIGYHLVKKLAQDKENEIIGLDNINNYYDQDLKYARLKDTGINRTEIKDLVQVKSESYPNYRFIKFDLIDKENLNKLFNEFTPDIVIHLAAQAGVRYSIDNPDAYIQSNIVGFLNILECCRHNKIKHLVYASSSSVYGNADKVPFSENDRVDFPISLYAATKKTDELMAHTYSYLYHLPTTGLRFFTVYGEWGRPDMSPILFAKAITEGNPIKVFNYGNLSRDFTYIDDITESIDRVINYIPNKNTTHPYYQLFNIGNSRPAQLMDFIKIMEIAIGKQAILEMYPMQQGDVKTTYADTTALEKAVGYKPKTDLKEGLRKFAEWWKNEGVINSGYVK